MADDYTAMNVAGSYNLGFMTLMGQYHQNEQGANEQTMMMIGANVPMGAGTFKVSYGTTEVTQGTLKGAEATQLAVGYVYDLSKRTAVYAHYSTVDNDAGLRFTTSASGPSVAAISGFKSTGFELGLRHSF
jgi:predicted porin